MSIGHSSQPACPFCEQPIAPGLPIAVCGICGQRHHAQCWEMNGQCTTKDCTGVPVMGTMDAIPEPPPPPQNAVAPPAASPTILPPPPIPSFIPSQGFPSDEIPALTPTDISAGSALSSGWEALKRNMGIAIGGLLIYTLLALIGAIPYLGYLFSILIAPPLSGGLIIFAFNIVKERNPQISDLFAGFQEYGKWMGVYWLLTAFYLLCLLPMYLSILAGTLVFFKGNETTRVIGGIIIAFGVIVSAVSLVVFMLRYILAYYAAADGYGIMESLRRSEELTRGKRGTLLWASIVIGCVNILGAVLLLVGLLWSIPLTILASTYLYFAVKAQHRA